MTKNTSEVKNTGANRNPGTVMTGAKKDNKIEDDNNKNNNGTSENKNNNRNNNISITNMYMINTQLVSFESGTPEIGSMGGLKSDRVKLIVSFKLFLEKLSNYIIKNLKFSRDVVRIFKSMKDPQKYFETNNMPKDLSEKYKKSEIIKSILTQKIKIYITQNQQL